MKSDGESLVDPHDVLNLAVFQGALMLGLLIFLVVIIVVIPGPEGAPPEGVFQSIEMMSAVHAFMTLGCVAAAAIVPKLVLANAVKAEGGELGFGDLRNAQLIRVSLLEGAALFGLVIIFMAKHGGVLQEQPLIWANALSTAVMLVVGLMTFPTRSRIERQLRDGAAGL